MTFFSITSFNTISIVIWMLSLQNICINYIIEHNINYDTWVTPRPLLELLDKNKIVKECGNIVNDSIIEINDEKNYDPWVGWFIGLNCQIGSKDHKYVNARCFERHLRKDIHNCGHPYSALSLYYLSQEDDFNSWYNDSTATRFGLIHGRCGAKYGHVDNLIKLHQIWHETNYIK